MGEEEEASRWDIPEERKSRQLAPWAEAGLGRGYQQVCVGADVCQLQGTSQPANIYAENIHLSDHMHLGPHDGQAESDHMHLGPTMDKHRAESPEPLALVPAWSLCVVGKVLSFCARQEADEGTHLVGLI